ncbi:uncharacterized protein LOC118461095 [Anopheles albimanus]|uniref:uncharacterized protein LOC118461095 n=1 Tax=Anopheles albimanus TaxID=7167 RepID=UPI00163EE248|nr:uncharacterized protein LOC118461095 [Anopheles albimanus]
MEKCKICGKYKSEYKLPSRSSTLDFDLKIHENDGELARIMYRLTQDIVVSKNFSDENINRICKKYLKKSSLSSKNVLLEAIENLKIKLKVRNQSSDIYNNAGEVRDKSDVLIWSQGNYHFMVDKCISAQSLPETSNITSAVEDKKLSPISSITTFDYSISNESEPHQPPTANESSSHGSSRSLKSDVSFGNNHGSSMDSSVDVLSRIVLASKNRKYK